MPGKTTITVTTMCHKLKHEKQTTVTS